MSSRPRSARRNHRNLHRLRHPPRQFTVKTPSNTVPIHAGQQDLPSPPSLRLNRPIDHPQPGGLPSARDINPRIPNRINRSSSPPSVNRNDHSLRSKAPTDLPNQLRPSNRAGIDADFIRARIKNRCSIFRRPNAATHRKWYKQRLCSPFHGLKQRPAPLMCSRNIEQNDLVRPATCMPMRQLRRIASVHDIDELDALHHPSTADVQAGNDALCQQLTSSHSCS